jgi:hypothetical protein
MQRGKKGKPNASNVSLKMPQKRISLKAAVLRKHRKTNLMTKPKSASNPAGNQRTNIRMSKLARATQTSAAKTNWTDMVKMLFRADPHSGRKEEVRKLISLKHGPVLPVQAASYSIDQIEYLFLLMLIISIAEKRTQELYAQEFSQRCDAIGKKYNLQDDEYWKDGTAPSEWHELNREFEKASLRILIETLSEYHQQEIADLIQTDGPEDFFEIIKNIRVQFVRVLTDSDPGGPNMQRSKAGSFPETLQSLHKMLSVKH